MFVERPTSNQFPFSCAMRNSGRHEGPIHVIRVSQLCFLKSKRRSCICRRQSAKRGGPRLILFILSFPPLAFSSRQSLCPCWRLRSWPHERRRLPDCCSKKKRLKTMRTTMTTSWWHPELAHFVVEEYLLSPSSSGLLVTVPVSSTSFCDFRKLQLHISCQDLWRPQRRFVACMFESDPE